MVLSRQGGALAKMLPLYKLGLGGKLASSRQMSCDSIDDEVAAIVLLLDHPISGAVNLTAPQPVTNKEFNHALGKAVHRPTLLPVPSSGRAAARRRAGRGPPLHQRPGRPRRPDPERPLRPPACPRR